jgi:hypothetical protein
MANPTLKMVTCIAAFSIMLLPAHGQEPGSGRLELQELPKGDADGFVTIIGDDNLGVWKGLANYWYSKRGVLGGRKTKENSKQTFIVFPFRLRDFELRLKYKFVSPQGNSGIQFRSKILDQETYRVGGYQADIDATGSLDGSLYDEAGVVGGRGTLSTVAIRRRGTWKTNVTQSRLQTVRVTEGHQRR